MASAVCFASDTVENLYGKMILPHGISLFRRQAVPVNRFDGIFGNAQATGVQQAEIAWGQRVTLFRGFAIPLGGLIPGIPC